MEEGPGACEYAHKHAGALSRTKVLRQARKEELRARSISVLAGLQQHGPESDFL